MLNLTYFICYGWVSLCMCFNNMKPSKFSSAVENWYSWIAYVHLLVSYHAFGACMLFVCLFVCLNKLHFKKLHTFKVCRWIGLTNACTLKPWPRSRCELTPPGLGFDGLFPVTLSQSICLLWWYIFPFGFLSNLLAFPWKLVSCILWKLVF